MNGRLIFLIGIGLALFLFTYFFLSKYSLLFAKSKNLQEFVIAPTEEHNIDGITVCFFDFGDRQLGKDLSKTVLFCHGNAGNITHRNYMIRLCSLAQVNLVLFDYEGYGKSSGSPSTYRILENGQTVLRWVQTRIPEDQLIIWGESLGGSVASYLASSCNCFRLVLFATFASLDDLAFGVSRPWYWDICSSLFRTIVNPLPTKNWLANVKCPTVILHSPNDEVIPYEHAQYLAKSNGASLLTIAGGHSTPIVSTEILEELFQFCNIEVELPQVTLCLQVFEDVAKEVWC